MSKNTNSNYMKSNLQVIARVFHLPSDDDKSNIS